VGRRIRWEFWPAWAVYLPLAPKLIYYAIRHRGIAVCTLANPAIPTGGLVGESKSHILSLLPLGHALPWALLPPGPPAQRLTLLLAAMKGEQWGGGSWPVVLKPDVGERGAGVRLIINEAAALDYLTRHHFAVLAQVHHPGPFEAGIFYVRRPNAERGYIFSITGKQFSQLTGDGVSPLEALIWRHPRYRLQAQTYLKRFAGQEGRVLKSGETLKLGFAGNHCQGTMFLDAPKWITPALTDAIDAIARQTRGFFFGRFDVRFEAIEAFTAGTDFKIIELNGLSSESTNIYDPSFSFFAGQRVLAAQWKIAYEIGAEVLRHLPRGARSAAMKAATTAFIAHLRRKDIDDAAD